ncbi:A/G-specific adenine glycosylase [Herminiimonas fonticola]|uniref:Adenine DNA glycosylase n=1 Tax=Herminiimonas fonticola TaxID=303380 RepID=A0A4R6GIC9_9BURK|nr:A/G-specific adenine glycosylase [Herminiimonas fonticola]RBA25045.1 mutY: A/G-specific adenine glycosylase [Herminiimonas fonticola]TDN94160.1 A/G-specific DNA-adenine glycosylase [Herminiimonas fonticola]
MKRVVNEQQAVADSSGQKTNAKKLAAKDVHAANLADPSFSKDVIDWQKQHGRHALPWQNTRDAYRVWLSEIMLQQTQVAAVIPYYQRFLQTFPTVESLAAAPSEEVMAHWSGLGYYSRARNLHKCAQAIVAQHAGVFPGDPVILEELPGIGRSTAAAIAAFSYGTRAAILDGNVKRVFARVFGVERYPGEKAVENEMWLRAVALLPATGVEAYTQGLMDLGATLCTRNRPSCNRCPLAQRCIAYATNRTNELPIRKPKKAVPEKSTVMLLIIDDDQILLEQRPDKGIWGGLLSLPEIDAALEPGNADFDVALMRATAAFGVPDSVEKLTEFSHTFTHFKLHITPYRISLARRLKIAGQSSHNWYPLHRMAVAPLPAPVKKLLLTLVHEPDLLSE